MLLKVGIRHRDIYPKAWCHIQVNGHFLTIGKSSPEELAQFVTLPLLGLGIQVQIHGHYNQIPIDYKN